jgi:hypothetical protein
MRKTRLVLHANAGADPSFSLFRKMLMKFPNHGDAGDTADNLATGFGSSNGLKAP